MDLYYIDGSPFARMVRVLLQEFDLAVTLHEIADFPPPDDLLAINPMGQVPVLVHDGHPIFPTRVVLDVLFSQGVRENGVVAATVSRPDHRIADEQILAVILAMGDALAAHHYAVWAGIGQTEPDRLGFNPIARNMLRVLTTLDWLEPRLGSNGFRPDGISIQDIALVCFILWTESRGPIKWRGRPKIERLVDKLAKRPSFTGTVPRPHQLID
jgi:glutathione S-transferase